MACLSNPPLLDDFSDVESQVDSLPCANRHFRMIVLLVTGIFAVIVWCTVIIRKETSPFTLMVEPAAEMLETGVTSSKDLSAISQELAFNVDVLDLKRIGGDLTAVGKSDFGGQHAAVMQYQYGDSIILVYTFPHRTSLFSDMKAVGSPGNRFYLTSGGAVSIIAWKDKDNAYRAMAAKATERDILRLAMSVVGGS